MVEGVVADLGWILIAFVSGLGARALRLPPLVGYLTAGMVLAMLGVTGGATLARVGELGIALLLFIVGLDLRWKNLVRPEVVGAGTVHLVAFALLSGFAGWALGLPALGATVVAISLGTSSLVLAAKALEIHRDLRAYHGRVAIGIILLQTVIATAALGVLGPAPSPWAAALLALPLSRRPLHALLDRIDTEELTLFFGLAVAVAGSGRGLFAHSSAGRDLAARDHRSDRGSDLFGHRAREPRGEHFLQLVAGSVERHCRYFAASTRRNQAFPTADGAWNGRRGNP